MPVRLMRLDCGAKSRKMLAWRRGLFGTLVVSTIVLPVGCAMLQQNDTSELQFSEKMLSLGDVPVDSVINFDTSIKNVTNRTVQCDKIAVSCGCLAVGALPPALKSGEERAVHFSLNTSGLIAGNSVTKKAMLYSEGRTESNSSCVIKGTVRPLFSLGEHDKVQLSRVNDTMRAIEIKRILANESTFASIRARSAENIRIDKIFESATLCTFQLSLANPATVGVAREVVFEAVTNLATGEYREVVSVQIEVADVAVSPEAYVVNVPNIQEQESSSVFSRTNRRFVITNALSVNAPFSIRAIKSSEEWLSVEKKSELEFQVGVVGRPPTGLASAEIFVDYRWGKDVQGKLIIPADVFVEH